MSKDVRFFTKEQVALATFLGNPSASGIMLGWNYLVVGQRQAAGIAAAACLAVALALWWLLPPGGSVIGQILSMGVTVWLAQRQYYESFFALEDQGAERRSWWTAVGLILAGNLMVGAILAALR
jgi:hypothetical protein